MLQLQLLLLLKIPKKFIKKFSFSKKLIRSELVKDDDELRKKVISYQDELQKLINESNQIQDKYDEKIKKRTVEINETIINELNNKALVIQNNQLKNKKEKERNRER